MKAHVSTASGKANIYQDETGVHLRIFETTGTVWEAGFFPAASYDEVSKAWESALSLAREIINPATANFGTRH
ncbi:hypothetical protein H7F10_07015 [Acidithiobacillus sp. HP-6]|uniref:hypothetical protein n=1 Tax=unclassified Acidithiobacillus TaxID=2614800 RepID=UPI00187AF914|nr:MULTISPECIES: hypothetical protein [unclassified Acidithiobacillus]MBE7562705.1 hypothetical protein [Acidithiobacillus sp. HP-6]MBE7570499.1 hypothetical protein [Acidithiobacillus sp. HP-2]